MAKHEVEYALEWKPDCQGKWDYDCEIVSLTCRYWPQGGGFSAYDSRSGEWEENEDRPEIKPSAIASICIGDLSSGPYEELIKAEFDGDAEEVKLDVEKWAAGIIKRVEAAVRKEFG